MTNVGKLKLSTIIAMFVLLFPLRSSAADLYFSTPKTKFVAGEQFTAAVLVDSREEPINAFEGRLVFPDNLEVKEIFIGDSIINFWVNKPTISQSDSIDFSGIIPGGFVGDKGLLFSVVFVAKFSGNAAIDFGNVRLLLNDGQGTMAAVKTANLKIKIDTAVPGAAEPQYLPFPDGVLPEPFSPILTRSSDVFSGSWFLVFAAQDKGSGIDYYEVCEGTQINCERADSPYVLKDQSLSGKIFVKAVDKRGNGRLVVLEPSGHESWYEKYQIYVIIILLFIASFLFTLRRYVYRRV